MLLQLQLINVIAEKILKLFNLQLKVGNWIADLRLSIGNPIINNIIILGEDETRAS